jgi:uncharacterized phage-associated protein
MNTMKTVDLAKDIVYFCRKDGYPFNNTKIQKLLYLFIGFALMNDIEEIKNIDELPKAWEYGPVFPKVYKNYSTAISNIPNDYTPSISKPEIKNILEKTVKLWGRVSAGKLSDWSHKEGSPWEVVLKNDHKWNQVIPLEMIYNYFSENVENVLEESEEVGLFGFIKKIFS